MKRLKNIIAAVVGTTLEIYDATLYLSFALVLGPIFFPNDDPLIVHLSAFGAIAAGYVARSLGALFFSHMGDRLGRKGALSLSIILVTLPTFVIGILPSYDSIGVWAPIILILCRLVQGFCIGGELGGAMTFIVENSEPRYKGFFSSLIAVASYFGGIIGAGLGALCMQPFMPAWGWRIPFLVGGAMGLFGYYIRQHIDETPAFSRVRKQGQILKYPILDVLKSHKINTFRAMGIAAGVLVPFFIVTAYLSGILETEQHFTPLEIIELELGLMIFWTVLSPCMGWTADQIGIANQMRIAAAILAIVSYPLFVLLEHSLHSFSVILFIQLCLSTLCVAFAAPCSAYLSSLFPTEERYSGISLGYTIGSTLLGGTAPLISTALLKWTGDQKAPAYYLCACAVGAFCAVTSFSYFRTKNLSNLKMKYLL